MQIRLMTIVALTLAAVASGVDAAEQAAPADPALAKAIAGKWRSAEQKSRDQYRHPAEALTFWGLKPGMTLLEVQPGGGWWTEILAPYARMTGGAYHATGADLANPKLAAGPRKSRADFEARLAAKPEIYGKATVHDFGPVAAPLPANTFDFILTARSVHGWAQNDQTDKVFANLFQALKPGGTLALEQHRAAPGNHNPKMGYVTEEYVLEHAKKAGFELVGKSEINANPKDTKDHPFGVWTLPPTGTTVPYGSGQPPDPSFDRSKYDAIGESDRMTLRFRKPG
jgi:predicted methyltransferase